MAGINSTVCSPSNVAVGGETFSAVVNYTYTGDSGTLTMLELFIRNGKGSTLRVICTKTVSQKISVNKTYTFTFDDASIPVDMAETILTETGTDSCSLYLGIRLTVALSGDAGLSTGDDKADSFTLLRERQAPVISGVTWSDRNTPDAYSIFGNLLKDYSLPSLTVAATADSRDPGLTLSYRLTLNSAVPESDTEKLDAGMIGTSGSVPWTVTVTDSRGMSSDLTGSVDVLPYYVPQFTPPSGKADYSERYRIDQSELTETYNYVQDDSGELVWLNFFSSVCPIEGASGVSNAYTLTMTVTDDSGNESVYTLLDRTQGDDVTAFEDRSYLDGITFASGTTFTVQYVLADLLRTTTVNADFIEKATAYFSVDKRGVSVGMLPSSGATIESPRFECNYPAYFYGDIEEGDIGYDIAEGETEIGTFLGKPLYRYVQAIPSQSSGTKTYSLSGIDGKISYVVHVFGTVALTIDSASWAIPLNTYYSSSIRAYARVKPSTNQAVVYTGGSSTGGYLILEYTKE